jgi:hypothetical protein
MNTEEYIKSGIIEDYCLGFLSPYEMEQVAKNAIHYTEIKNAIDVYENALKQYAAERILKQKNKEGKTNRLSDEESVGGEE